jgi:hypothetical protein
VGLRVTSSRRIEERSTAVVTGVPSSTLDPPLAVARTVHGVLWDEQATQDSEVQVVETAEQELVEGKLCP